MTIWFGEPNARGDSLGDLDPAQLAFIKCHITSALKWDVLRAMADRVDQWISAADLARAIHRDVPQVESALAEMQAEALVAGHQDGAELCYCLPAAEPSTVVLRRLIQTCMHNQALRGVIAEHLLHLRHPVGRAA